MTDRWADWGSDGEVSVAALPRGFWVYVAWGADRTRPLYIGKARAPLYRLSQHAAIPAPWVAELVELECHSFPNEAWAERAEIEAIAYLNPIYNRMRRWTQAQWDEDRKQRAIKKRLRTLARKKAAAKPARHPRPKPEPLLEPRRPKPIRVQRWREDIFTPDQLAIIARVQSRGRIARASTGEASMPLDQEQPRLDAALAG